MCYHVTSAINLFSSCCSNSEPQKKNNGYPFSYSHNDIKVPGVHYIWYQSQVTKLGPNGLINIQVCGNYMIWIWDIIVTYGYAFDKKIVYCWDHRTKLVAWIFPTHGVSCMNWNTRRVICLIDEWENEDSIRFDATHLCKIYLCYSEIVLVRLMCIILTHQERILERK